MATKEESRGTPSVRDYGLLVRPLTTEKTTLLGGEEGTAVAFEVQRSASKTEIKAAIERVFGVEVARVRTLTKLGKLKRTTRAAGRTKSVKKAYVTLKPGHSIDIFDGI